MRKKLFLVLAAVFVSVGAFVFLNRSRPPVDTKFVQNVSQRNAADRQTSDESISLEIKTPGDYADIGQMNHTYQTFNNCGPATLSMILNWLGQDITQKELGDQMRPYQNQSGDNDDKTIFTYEFVDWAKEYGFEAVGRVNGDIDLLKTFTANGIPVVVKTWLNTNEDIGHFRIVKGFDENREVIIQNDSYDGPGKRISYYDFLSMWQPFNYDYMVVYTSDQADLVEAIIGDEMEENVDWENALARAQKENELDPENVYPYFNMSTSYYHLGDYEESVRIFELIQSRLPRRMLWYQIEPILSYEKLGYHDKVFEITQNILDNGNRAFSELYQLRGEIYLKQGNTDAARPEFEKALLYNKNYVPAQNSLENI